MTSHIRVTLDLRTDLTPRETGEYLQVLIDEGTAFNLDVTALHSKEVKPIGRAPISDETKARVLRMRKMGDTYPVIANLTALSRASVIRICKAENA